MRRKSSLESTKAFPALTHRLAQLRYRLRTFLRFSERAARAHGVTPLQHQLLLGIAGFTGRGWANVSELAEFLQERHNAVVSLIQRAERRGLVRKEHSSKDHRFVRVDLTARGERVLRKLSELHRAELKRFQAGLLRISQNAPRTPRPLRGGGRVGRA
ncbi:MAG: MarR family transcriptional regulator [Acidobacteriia bacterium]|nr:MarR family transcriptional regulator [Terriglobia bacterium]